MQTQHFYKIIRICLVSVCLFGNVAAKATELAIPFLQGQYQGQTLGGLPHGKGVYIQSETVRISGQFRKGEPVGEMTVYNGGIVSVSPLKNWVRHGFGYTIWPDRSRFDGEFQDGGMHYGVYKRADGLLYKGGFIYTQNGWFFEGKGHLTYPDGAVFMGSFNLGKRHGDGQITAPNALGWVFRGSFENDALWHGSRQFADGRVEQVIANVVQGASPEIGVVNNNSLAQVKR